MSSSKLDLSSSHDWTGQTMVFDRFPLDCCYLFLIKPAENRDLNSLKDCCFIIWTPDNAQVICPFTAIGLAPYGQFTGWSICSYPTNFHETVYPQKGCAFPKTSWSALEADFSAETLCLHLNTMIQTISASKMSAQSEVLTLDEWKAEACRDRG